MALKPPTPFLLLLFLFSSLPSLYSSKQTATNGFSVELIRLPSVSPQDFQSTVLPNNADHVMKLSVGTPPRPALFLVDTGSDLVWSRCHPCVDCKGRKVPSFDPTLSSTYKNLSCSSPLCKALSPSACSKGPTCRYNYRYVGTFFSDGVLAGETFTFESTKIGSSVSIPAIGFGCSHNTSTEIDGSQIGIVGLGGGPLSLISQLGPSINWKFSYCLVPFNEKTSNSVMNFGDKAVLTGPNVVSTPLVVKDFKTYYHVTLQSIIIKEREIVVPSSVPGNIFIDSGSTLTTLSTDVFNKLADAVAAAVKRPRTTGPGGGFACYNATSRGGFPQIRFNFAGGAGLVLNPINTFTLPSPQRLVCLAMLPTSGTQVFGNLVQQNFHVAYDLAAKKVSFAPAQCSKLR